MAMGRGSTATLATLCLVLLCLAVLPIHAASNCKDRTEVYYVANGEDYRGHVNVTETGLTCQKWSSQYPNAHEVALDPAQGIGDHNYCRNPNSLERPGCFTTQPGGGYQFCNVGDVCKDYPQAKATIFFSPPSGVVLKQDGSANYVSIACYPRPCSLYYSFGAESLATAASTPYTQPLLLQSDATIKAYAVFQNAEPMRIQASYTVRPTTTAVPQTPLLFIPSDTVIYDRPILVMLQGVTDYDHVLMYWDADFMNPTVYNGSFWLSTSTSIYAIVNHTFPVLANYVLNFTVPPLEVYPSSGRYLGGVTVLVRDPQPPSRYYMYVNESREVEMLPDLLFAWTAVGTSTLDIRALHVHRLESRNRVVYEVVEARPPTISPDPAFAYYRPMNVTCATPLHKLVPLTIFRDAAMEQVVAEDVYSAVLRTPGSFTVTCSYIDDLGEAHTTTSTLEMVAVPMQSPTFSPECGTSFPAVALSLQTLLDLSQLLPGAEASSWSVYGFATGGASIPMIARSSENESVFTYDLFPGPVTSEPTRVVVSMMAHSQDPLEADSPASNCSYLLYPLGTAATPFFSARPACAMTMTTTAAPVSAACITTLQVQLASCLNLYSSELLSITPVGPFVILRMTGLADALRPVMFFRLGWCLASLQEQQQLFELQNETSKTLVMATSWHVATPTRMATHVFTGLPVTVHIEGFHAGSGAYHMVRSDYDCEDIGVAPEAVLSGSPYATTAASPATTDDGSAWITFRFAVAGGYKLCAYVSDALYTVPFSAAPSGNWSEAWTPSATAYLKVIVQPFPSVAAVPADECGGLIPPAMEHVPLAVSMAAFPSGAFTSLAYARDSSSWTTAALPVDAATQLTGAVSIAVGPLNSATRPVQVLDTTLGPTTGAAQTCVFFVSAAGTSTTTPPAVTYLFYTVNTSAVPTGSTGVMLLLQGSFHPSQLIVIDVNEVADTSSSITVAGMQLIRRVTAHVSAATAYTVALPDAVLGLTAGARVTPFVIHATLDGVQVTAVPSTVALSPLSLAMTSCAECASGLCYDGACVCKHKKTKVMHMCGDGDGDSSEGSDSDILPSARPTTTTTAAPDDDDDDVTPASVGERLLFLLIYLGLLAGIGAYILISIRRSSARRGSAVQAEEITVEPA